MLEKQHYQGFYADPSIQRWKDANSRSSLGYAERGV
jgi:hypothetical protein